MNKSKIIISLILVLMLAVSGCSQSTNNEVDVSESSVSNQSTTEKRLEVFTTIYPITAITQAIASDLVNVTPIVPIGADPHDFEPAAKTIASLESADVLFYNGAEMEPWVEDVVENLKESGVTTVNIAEALGLETHDHDGDHDDDHNGAHDGDHDDDHNGAHDGDHDGAHDGDHDGDHDGAHDGDHNGAHDGDHDGDHNDAHDDDHNGNHEADHHHHHGMDPHYWSDPVLAKQEAKIIYETLKDKVGSEDIKILEKNYQDVIKKLETIDKNYKDKFTALKSKDLVVGHAAFGYMCKRYGLNQIAVSGLSTLEEPSSADLAKITDIVKKKGVRVVFYDALGSNKFTKVIATEVGVEMLPLNPLGSISQKDLEAGEDYFSLLEKNFKTIIEALNQ